MTHTFTQHLLVKLLYKEVTRGESVQLQRLFASNAAACENYRDLKHTQRLLSNVRFNAPSAAMRKILTYSKQLPLSLQEEV
ncbi:MAG: hypothetical protein NWR67_10080 [Saprospiraceae bacterium]|jgi:hypothetical protein|nr:hypothetical protein [Saprospiraceae bacterium]MDP4821346.1 hypothetical protein [Saprospiraceae bacterium]MDP4998633.1 hypothetical protein [Saprospiraceae bacterium]